MNIILLVTGKLELPPDLMPMVEHNVHDNSCHSRERQSIRKGELRWQEKRRVLLVRCLVEVEVTVEDPRDVVDGARVIVGLG